MIEEGLYKLKYPIGEFVLPEPNTISDVTSYIKVIEELPSQIRREVEDLSEEQLDTPYRPEGWTIRQVIHHLPDSHLNSYIRFKWALTERNPIIKAYDETAWAELPDANSAPIDISLDLLESLHKRWVVVLKNLSPSDLNETFIHPETGAEIRLDVNIANYAWHSEHHLAHIVNLKKRMAWG